MKSVTPSAPPEKILIYGAAKSQKSRLAVSHDFGGKSVYVTYDARVAKGASDEELARAAGYATKSLPAAALASLEIVVPTGEPNWLEEAHAIALRKDAATLIVDPISVLAENLLAEYASTGVSGAPAGSFGNKATGSYHAHPSEAHYGAVQSSIMFILLALVRSPLNVIVVAHPEWRQPKSGAPEMLTGGPKTVGHAQLHVIPGIFDTFRTEVISGANPRTVVHTLTKGPWLAGERVPTPRPAEIIVGPDPAAFWRQLHGSAK